jgi:hypothetical protein
MSTSGGDQARVIGDRTLDARLSERRRTALLTLPALLIGAAIVAALRLTELSHPTLYALQLGASMGYAMVVGALELDHERPFLQREIALGVSPQDVLSGKLRALWPLVIAQSILFILPYIPLAYGIAPPGWLVMSTMCCGMLGLMLGLAASTRGQDRRAPLAISASLTIAQTIWCATLALWSAPAWAWCLTPVSALGLSLSAFERGMQDGDLSMGFVTMSVMTALWAALLLKIARVCFSQLSRSSLAQAS